MSERNPYSAFAEIVESELLVPQIRDMTEAERDDHRIRLAAEGEPFLLVHFNRLCRVADDE